MHKNVRTVYKVKLPKIIVLEVDLLCALLDINS